jgi:hypothetical protein
MPNRVAAAPQVAVAALAAGAPVAGIGRAVLQHAARCVPAASSASLGLAAVAALAAVGRLDLAVAHGHTGVQRDDADPRVAVLAALPPWPPEPSAPPEPLPAPPWTLRRIRRACPCGHCLRRRPGPACPSRRRRPSPLPSRPR